MTDASVELWGRQIGAVSWYDKRSIAAFQYTPEFTSGDIEVSPLVMPLRDAPYEFPNLSRDTFKGLPGMLADCLPDKFGNALIDVWLAQQNRLPESFNPVERLCYAGSRAMGALEFKPSLRDSAQADRLIDVAELTSLANAILSERESLQGNLFSITNAQENSTAVQEILRVGTSAGGARAKAVLAWNEKTGAFKSGQTAADPGFSHWLLKFDGVSNNTDKELADPMGYGRIEYAYSLMAKEAGLAMSECRLFEEGGRAHFMTRRFDRPAGEPKIHYASLYGLAHMAYSAPGTHSHSYEDYFEVIEALDLSPESRLEAYRRMVFNVFGCNRDDHTKNFGFVMDESGEWGLAPAFDITYAFNPLPGKWTATQQMSIGGKREAVTREDLWAIGRQCSVATLPKLKSAIDTVISALENWSGFAQKAGVGDEVSSRIQAAIRSSVS